MSEATLKYNYVITGDKMYAPPMFRDIALLEGVKLYSDINEDFNKWWSYVPFRLHFSKKVNNWFGSLFDEYVEHRLYQPVFKAPDKPRCIIFISDRIEIYQNQHLLDSLRRRHKGIKLVLYLTDLIARHKNFNLEYARHNFDLIISYDYGDSKKYNLFFYSTPHCKIDAARDNSIKESDVYFCGKAKGTKRLTKIINIFEKCQEMGLKCDFNITEVPHLQRVYTNLIHYNEKISYLENNQHIQQTKAILEIMQEDAIGFTPRLWDCIVNEKYLITDNYQIQSSPYYREEGMFFTDSLPDNLDLRLNTRLHYPQKYKDQLNPIHFIEFLEEKLSTL